MSNRPGAAAGGAAAGGSGESSRLDPFRCVPACWGCCWPALGRCCSPPPCHDAALRSCAAAPLIPCTAPRPPHCSRRATRPQIYWSTKRQADGEGGDAAQDPSAAAAADEANGAGDADGGAAGKGRGKGGRLDLDAIVDLSALDLAVLERPARMPPLARVRRRPLPLGGRVQAWRSGPAAARWVWRSVQLLSLATGPSPLTLPPPHKSRRSSQKLLGPTWRPGPPPPGLPVVSLDEYKRSRGWA